MRELIDEAHVVATRILNEHRPLLEKLAGVLMEVETLEGDTLKRLLDSDPTEPWPPADMEPPKPDAPVPPPSAEDTPLRPAFEPKPATGLAWEGGNQTRTE